MWESVAGRKQGQVEGVGGGGWWAVERVRVEKGGVIVARGM